MRSRTVQLGVFVLALLIAAAAHASDYYYESVTTTQGNGGGGQQEMMRGWVDGTNVRIEFPQGGRGGRAEAGSYILTTDAGETLYMVNPSEKSYFEFNIGDLMSSLGEASGGMVDIEFRDMSGEMLSEEPGGTVLGHDSTKYRLRSQFTMEMNVMGMQRVSNMDTTQDVWMTRDVGGEAWTMWLKMLPSGGDAEKYVDWARQSGLTDGFPLKTSSQTTITDQKGRTSKMSSEMEVTVLREEAVEASMFEIPPDYTKLEMLPPEWSGGSGEAESPMKQLRGMFGRKNKNDGR